MITEVSPELWLLEEPNYYRLLYQIARTHVNRALEIDEAGPEAQDHSAAQLMEQGAKTAAKLRTNATDTLERYKQKEKENQSSWRRFWRDDLSPREKRIWRLLEQTVLPCTELLIAATLLYAKQTDEADGRVEPIRQAASTRTLSYRVYYNLACYTVGRARTGEHSTTPGAEALAQALSDLRKSFMLARDPRKAQLVDWAGEDPSLAFLRSHSRFKPRFDALLARYGAPDSQDAGKKPPPTLDGF